MKSASIFHRDRSSFQRGGKNQARSSASYLEYGDGNARATPCNYGTVCLFCG